MMMVSFALNKNKSLLWSIASLDNESGSGND